MAATPGMWIGIRSVPTYGGAVVPPGDPVIGACAVLTQQAKPIAMLARQIKPIATLTQRSC